MTTDLFRAIQQLSSQPIPHQVVMSLLRAYGNPHDKANELVRKGILLPIRRGLYIAGPAIEGPKPEPMLLANHLVGPSYVTSDTALSYHGLIPERVYMLISATTKKPRTLNTPAGIFRYHFLDVPYYGFGIRSQQVNDHQYAMIASPVKALFDKIAFTPHLRVRSTLQATRLLVEDLRMDEDALRKLPAREALEWLPDAPKADSLHYIIQAIQQL